MVFSQRTRLRIGVLGASKVLRKTWIAIYEAGHEIVAVGCRDIYRGQKLVDELYDSLSFKNKPFIGNYKEIVTSPKVDIVYIAIPVMERNKWVLECANNGKHVLVEKPTAESCQQLQNWLEHLASKRLLLMDGTMLSHGNRIHDVRLAMREIGKIRRMEAYFSFLASEEFLKDNIRLDPTLEPMGAMGDLGWYCVRYFLHLMNFAMPTSVIGRVVQCSGIKNGISAFSGELIFKIDENSIIASFFCTFHATHEQIIRIKGDDGIITVHGAINPTDIEELTFTIERNSFEFSNETMIPIFNRNVETRYCNENHSFQMVQLWRDVGLALLRNDPAEPLVVLPEKSEKWAQMAWVTQCVCDKLMESAKKSAEKFKREVKLVGEAKVSLSDSEKNNISNENDGTDREISLTTTTATTPGQFPVLPTVSPAKKMIISVEEV